MPNLPEGTGRSIAYTLVDPGAGANAVFPVPAGARWRVHCINVVLTTDANVANRSVGLVVTRSGTAAQAYYSGLVTPASTTTQYVFEEQIQEPAAIRYGFAFAPLPAQIILEATDIITVTVLNGVIGDALTSCTIAVEEWIEP